MPPAVTAWFAGPGTTALIAGIAGEIAAEVNPSGLTVSVSAPVPTYNLKPPTCDLRAKKVQGGLGAASGITATKDYCARAYFGGVPGNFLQCAQLNADGTVSEIGGDEVHFSNTVPWDQVRAILKVRDAVYSLDGSHANITALDERANYNLGAVGTAPVSDFVTALAKQNAELAVMESVEGQLSGGYPPILNAADPDGSTAGWRQQYATDAARQSEKAGGSTFDWERVVLITLGAALFLGALIVVAKSRTSRRNDPEKIVVGS